jgi:SAM-dependent methyltransferase
MYIFQPDRYLLTRQIRENASYIKGKTLDVGAGEMDRYGKFFKNVKIVRMDVNHRDTVDLVGSADCIPASDSEFDSIICTQVFEHLADPWKSAQELYRVLKLGGHVLLTVPQMNELHEEPHDYFRYTKYGLKAMFEKAGFKIEKIDQRGAYFSTLAQIKIRHFIGIFNLYKRPFLGRVIGKILKIYGMFMIYLDKIDRSSDNKTQTIGWCVILKK